MPQPVKVGEDPGVSSHWEPLSSQKLRVSSHRKNGSESIKARKGIKTEFFGDAKPSGFAFVRIHKSP